MSFNSMAGWGQSTAVPQLSVNNVLPNTNDPMLLGGLLPNAVAPLAPTGSNFSLNTNGPNVIPTGAGGSNWFSNLPDWMQGAIGTKDQPGWGGMAIGAASGLMNAYMGMQQLGLAKESLAFSKDSFNRQFNNQAKLTNASLEDRQAARVASNAGAYQSVGDYMNKNRVG